MIAFMNAPSWFRTHGHSKQESIALFIIQFIFKFAPSRTFARLPAPMRQAYSWIMGTVSEFLSSEPIERVDGPGFTAYWIGKPQPSKDMIVLVCTHGGAYVAGNARMYAAGAYSWWLRKAAERNIPLRILSIEYTLINVKMKYDGVLCNQEAIDECLASYKWLIQDQNIPAERIFLSGDSAGGQLAVVAALNIRDHKLPQPNSLILASPWISMTDEFVPTKWDDESADYLNPPMMARWSYFLNLRNQDAKHPFLSPIYADLQNLAAIYVCYGKRELLGNAIHEFAQKAKSAGNDLTEVAHPHLPHVYPFAGSIIGKAAFEELGNMLDYIEKRIEKLPSSKKSKE